MINFIRRKFISLTSNRRITQHILDSMDKRFVVFCNCEFVEDVDFSSFCAIGLFGCTAKDVKLPSQPYSTFEKFLAFFRILPRSSVLHSCIMGNLELSARQALNLTGLGAEKEKRTLH